jgi:predicted nuclease of predicted toxin-antitoxin system
MRFLVDMGLAVRVAEWLRSQGHDACHLDEIGLRRISDDEIFAKAAAERRIIITTALDFGEIVAHGHGRVVSAVVLRLARPRTDRVIERLTKVIGEAGAALQDGAIVLVEEARHRVRRLPPRLFAVAFYGLVSLISIRRLRR